MLIIEGLVCLSVFIVAVFVGLSLLCMRPFPVTRPPEPEPIGEDVASLIRSLWSLDTEIRRRAADALGRLGTSARSAAASLRAAADRDEDEAVRRAAAQALACVSPAKAPKNRRR